MAISDLESSSLSDAPAGKKRFFPEFDFIPALSVSPPALNPSKSSQSSVVVRLPLPLWERRSERQAKYLSGKDIRRPGKHRDEKNGLNVVVRNFCLALPGCCSAQLANFFSLPFISELAMQPLAIIILNLKDHMQLVFSTERFNNFPLVPQTLREWMVSIYALFQRVCTVALPLLPSHAGRTARLWLR